MPRLELDDPTDLETGFGWELYFMLLLYAFAVTFAILEFLSWLEQRLGWRKGAKSDKTDILPP